MAVPSQLVSQENLLPANRNIDSSVDTATRTLVRVSIPDRGKILPLSTTVRTMREGGGYVGASYIRRSMKLDTRLHLVPR